MGRTIVLGSDHRGYRVKSQLVEFLRDRGEMVVDAGPFSDERSDYPDFAKAVAEQVVKGDNLGVLVCGSGIGMSIAANKVAGVRAALCFVPELAELARKHNDANILCLSADFVDLPTNQRNVTAWLDAKFDGGRHVDRLKKVHALETSCSPRTTP